LKFEDFLVFKWPTQESSFLKRPRTQIGVNMTLKNELTAEEIAKLTQESVGVVELSDENLQMVSGGWVPNTLQRTACYRIGVC
jgi:hypothetical protein